MHKSPEKMVAAERILVIDDNEGILQSVELLLSLAGYQVITAGTGRVGLRKFEEGEFDLVVTDMRLPDITGLDVIRTVKEANRGVPVILMTSFSSVENAVEAIRQGAHDYIIKPFNNDDFCFSVERALKLVRIEKENVLLKRSLKKAYAGQHPIIGRSPCIQRIMDLVQRAAPTDSNILVQGESGTGKELVAQAIHLASNRSSGPFVAINCGAIPAELLESELFGHEKGAYSGAVTAAEGLIREAHGGTLFLDEIADLSFNLQVKLLRVLQERQIRPVGGKQTYNIDVRFVAACNRDLREAMTRGEFREDLYYRLNVIGIRVPPLRERGRDIELLAEHFLNYYNRKLGKQILEISPDLLIFLRSYHWPGNVRELQNVIERAVILTEGNVLGGYDLPEVVGMPGAAGGGGLVEEALESMMSMEEYAFEFVKRYQDTLSEKDLAARLGICRKALWERRNKWNLTRLTTAPRKRRANGDD